MNVPQQQHQQTDQHHGPEIVMNDQETWEGEEGEDGDVRESSSEHLQTRLSLLLSLIRQLIIRKISNLTNDLSISYFIS